MIKYFTKHPENNCMSYSKHFWFSCSLGITFFQYGIKAFIHALVPEFFTNSTHESIIIIKTLLDNSGCNEQYHLKDF